MTGQLKQSCDDVMKLVPSAAALLAEAWMWLLLDWTVVAVLETEEMADDVAITTSPASMKASW